MNMINLCAVTTCSTMEELVNQILSLKELKSFIEVRIDYLRNLKKIDLLSLKNLTSQEVIITCRRKNEGGKWSGTENERIHVLMKAFDLGFIVDVELSTLLEGKLKLSPVMQKKTIISFHNFKKTPDITELKILSSKMDEFNPWAKKIATTVRNESDVKTLIHLLMNKKVEERMCVIGMGEKGKIIRVMSPLLGGYITYCSINATGSAPGQMSCGQMKSIYKLIS